MVQPACSSIDLGGGFPTIVCRFLSPADDLVPLSRPFFAGVSHLLPKQCTFCQRKCCQLYFNRLTIRFGSAEFAEIGELLRTKTY